MSVQHNVLELANFLNEFGYSALRQNGESQLPLFKTEVENYEESHVDNQRISHLLKDLGEKIRLNGGIEKLNSGFEDLPEEEKERKLDEKLAALFKMSIIQQDSS